MIDVTDATFQTEVLDKSNSVPVVVDLWAPWCGPCRALGPIIEKVVDETKGAVTLVKVNVDENPGISQAFKVQSIPAVFALDGGKVVDSFVGALPEHEVRAFVEKLAPGTSEVDVLVETGDEASLEKALELDPNSGKVAAALALLYLERGESERAETLLNKYPEIDEIARAKAKVRLTAANIANMSEVDIEAELNALLSQVKGDEEARQRYVDLLTLFPESDPRVLSYRRQLTSRLF